MFFAARAIYPFYRPSRYKTNLFFTSSILDAATSSGILKAKQKLGRTFNSDKLGGIAFTKISKLTMCSAGLGGSPGHCTSQHHQAPALHRLSFENFVKSMPPSLSKLKVLPSFCFPFKIPDNPTTTSIYVVCMSSGDLLI